MWLLPQVPCPLIGPFIFRDLVCHYQLVNPGLVLCVGLILPCRSFRQLPPCCVEWLSFSSSKVVPLHLDNSTAIAYLCNQGGTVSPFISRLACQILVLTNKHSITLIPAYIPIHLNVEDDYLSWGQLLLEWHLLSHMAQVAFHLWISQRRICRHPPIPLNASIITPGKHCYLWGPWS